MSEAPPPTGAPRWRERLKLAAFAVIPALLLLVAAEFAARLTITRRARTEDGVYVMRIGRWPWSRTSTTRLNPQGFPDGDFGSLPPKGDCVHLVLVGDSFILGDGVDLDSNFVSLVRRRREAAGGSPCVRLFNLGRRGTSIGEQALAVRETIGLLSPDVVILGQYQNDLTDLREPETRADSARVAATGVSGAGVVSEQVTWLNPSLVRFLSYRGIGFMIEHGLRRDLLARWSVIADTTKREEAARLMARYEAGFDSLATALADRGIAFGVVVIPSKFDVLAGRYPEEDFFVRLAEARGLPVLRAFPLLDAHRSPYAFLMYDGHLNEHGNRLMADTLYTWLFDDPTRFPALHGAGAPAAPLRGSSGR